MIIKKWNGTEKCSYFLQGLRPFLMAYKTHSTKKKKLFHRSYWKKIEVSVNVYPDTGDY